MDFGFYPYFVAVGILIFALYEWERSNKTKRLNDGGRKVLDLAIDKWRSHGFVVEHPEYVPHMDAFYVTLKKYVDDIAIAVLLTQQREKVHAKVSFYGGQRGYSHTDSFHIDAMDDHLMQDLLDDPVAARDSLEYQRKRELERKSALTA